MAQDDIDSIRHQAKTLERKAQELLKEKKLDEAFSHFDEAAFCYRKIGDSMKAALCFASAASCWNFRIGRQPIRNAATRSHFAAEEAVKVKNYAYARWLYREAALLYEQEGDFEKYSQCFMTAQDTYIKSLWEQFMTGVQRQGLGQLEEALSWHRRGMAFVRWFFGSLSRWVWGYGEKPKRTFLAAVITMAAAALLFYFSGLIQVNGELRPISWFESLYVSVVTFTTLGYGDFVPLGWARFVSMAEALTGIFLMPLFMIALVRHYMRIYR